jgi:hypothetical protein
MRNDEAAGSARHRSDSAALGGRATRKDVAITFGDGAAARRMDLLVYVPNPPRAPAPVFLGLNFQRNDAVKWPVETIVDRGYGVATAFYGDLFWAWAVSRALDYLETDRAVDANFVSDPVFRSRLKSTPEADPDAVGEAFERVVSNPALKWDALPRVVEAVRDRAVVVFDSGIRRGADVVKALALGARGVLVGRPYAYGLAVGGEEGVRDVVSNLLADLDLTLALAGCASVAELGAANLVEA